MTLFPRLLGIGCLAVTLAAHSPAQVPSTPAGVPSENALDSWLLSGDPRLVAWGAHDALMARDPNLIPDLLSLASHWQPLSRQTPDPSTSPAGLSPEQTDERDAMAAVLDALIQMNVSVPADTLRTLAPDFGNDVAVLLSRMPAEQAGPLSYDLYRSPAEHGHGLQYVSAALLALHPVPGFAADLLANIKVRATIFAILPGSEQFGGGESGSCAGSSELPREDWPVTGQYALSKENGDAAVLLVAGTDPIYATREESTHYLDDRCGSGVYLSPGERLRLIAEMLGISPEAIPWQTELMTNIEFQSLGQFDNALLAFVEEQQEKYRATLAALTARNLVTPSESQESLPQLELKLNDMRGEGATPIPNPPNLPSHVQWSSTPY
jgi:hypothetical protein